MWFVCSIPNQPEVVPAEVEDDDFDEEDDMPLAALAAKLQFNGLELEEEDLKLYLEIDANLETTAPLTDEAIIEQVQSSQEEEEEEEEKEAEQTPTEKIPTNSESIHALKTFFLFLQSIPHDDSAMEQLRNQEKLAIKNSYVALIQKTISDFFK